jgi:hypothetical protein
MYLPHGQSSKQGLPNCTECHGCSTELTPIGSLPGSFLGVEVGQLAQPGARCCSCSSAPAAPAGGPRSCWLQLSLAGCLLTAHLLPWPPLQVAQQEDLGEGMYRSFWAKTKRTASGMAMVRVYCLPPARGQEGTSQVRWAHWRALRPGACTYRLHLPA